MKLTTVLAVFLSAAPVLAATENTKQACSDGVDNDGDGRVDCADQDCWDLLMCVEEAPTAQAPPRRAAYTKLVLGAVLLPVGIILAGLSALPWSLASSTESSSKREAMQGAGATLDIVGLGAMAAGTAFLAIGVGSVAEARQRRAQIVPSLGPQSASLSLAVRF